MNTDGDTYGAQHVPVLLDRCLELLGPALDRREAIYLDATLGLGGHMAAVLDRHPGAKGIGVDRDADALRSATERLSAVGDRFQGVEAVYDEVDDVLDAADIRSVDAVLMDLGVSSMQLDDDHRGFSYSRDTPLDMRMGRTGPTAADVLNTYDEKALARVLWVHGEEKFSRRIAAAVVAQRAGEPFVTSARLVELLYAVIPAPARRTGGHPAKRVFQALRIEVNDELAALSRALPAWLDRLRPGGRLVVLAYHSGEDRIAKRALAAATTIDSPPGLPVEPPPAPFALLVKGAEKADAAEAATNPRSASVRLRAVQRRTS